MDLYFSAAKVLQKLDRREGSIKGLTLQGDVHKSGGSSAAAAGDKKNGVRLYALVLETLKYREVLDAIILSSGLLSAERKLSKEKALTQVLVHDALFNKRGIVARHPLQAAVDRHRARLRAELTRLQLRRGAKHVRELARADDAFVARWARVNRVLLDLPSAVAQLERSGYRLVGALAQLGERVERRFCIDPHIPDLLAFHPDAKVTEEPLYRSGGLVLQNKASCFPAHLLAPPVGSTVLDGCAAPGNKTSHAAAILHAQHASAVSRLGGGGARQSDGEAKSKRKRKRDADYSSANKASQVVAFERDPRRVLVLRSMLAKAGLPALLDKSDTAAAAGGLASVAAKRDAHNGGGRGNDDGTGRGSESGVVMRVLHEDFTRIPPTDARVSAATHIMLDPSCSGSGIVNRLDYLTASASASASATAPPGPPAQTAPASAASSGGASAVRADPVAEEADEQDLPTDGGVGGGGGGETDRLASLAAFQLAILTHAMSFPLAERIVYSTCSVHAVEDEGVVVAALLGQAPIARKAGGQSGWSEWRVAPRATALPGWPVRGRLQAVVDAGYPTPTAPASATAATATASDGARDGLKPKSRSSGKNAQKDQSQITASEVAQGMIRCLPGVSPTDPAAGSPATTRATTTVVAAGAGHDEVDDERLTPADRATAAGTIGFFVAVLERHRLDDPVADDALPPATTVMDGDKNGDKEGTAHEDEDGGTAASDDESEGAIDPTTILTASKKRKKAKSKKKNKKKKQKTATA